MKKILTIFLILAFSLALALSLPFVSAAATELEAIQPGVHSLGVIFMQARLRELDYLYFIPSGNYASMTQNAVSAFQQTNGLPATGTADHATLNLLYSIQAKRAILSTNIKINGPGAIKQQAAGVLLDWPSASSQLKGETPFTVIDFNTGTAFRLVRTGGVNHAYVEPQDAGATQALTSIFIDGSWEKRAVLVNINGTLYAASLSGAPYGNDKIPTNDLAGHLELYFQGSTSDLSALPDIDHNRMIQRAAGYQDT
ncbi:MAG: peptidoglycan-binding domain-containing protein [Christensenellales bacterium]